MNKFKLGVAALLLAAVVAAQTTTPSMIFTAPPATAAVVDGQNINPAVVKAGIVDAGTIVATTVVNTPLLTANVVDAGTVRASTFDSYAASGSTAYSMTQSSKLCFNGIANACMEYGGGTNDVQVSGTGGFISPGTLTSQGDLRVSDQISNPGSGAACSGFASSVCVDDPTGFAVANGSGVVKFVAQETGRVGATRFTSDAGVGDLAFVNPTGTYSCFNGTTCTSFVRHDGVGADMEIGSNSPLTVTANTTISAASLKVGNSGWAYASEIEYSATLDFPDTLINTCDDLTITAGATTATSQVTLTVPAASVEDGSIYFWWPTAAVINVRHCCVGAATCNPDSASFVAVSKNE